MKQKIKKKNEWETRNYVHMNEFLNNTGCGFQEVERTRNNKTERWLDEAENELEIEEEFINEEEYD
jgi:hypothetical protein